MPESAFVAGVGDMGRYGLGDEIAQWEDGARTDGTPGSYEWWYFDIRCANGAKVVVAFMNKDFTQPTRPMKPIVRIDLELPDGRTIGRSGIYAATAFAASKDGCDVCIGPNTCVGDLRAYRVHAEVGDTTIDVELTGTVPAWRPGAGAILFGNDRAKEFWWLPAVPQGDAAVTYTIGDDTVEVAGVGYHDHNWGNVPLPDVVHHWYWARGQAGPYSVIAADITAEKRYGYQAMPVFLLARDGEIIADDAGRVTFEASDVRVDGASGKPVADVTRYTYRDGEDEYRVTFTREKDIARMLMVDAIKGWRKAAAKLVGFDGAYLRFSGSLDVVRLKAGEVAESHRETAFWELMYFGKTTPMA